MKPNHSKEYREDLKRFPSRKGRSFHHFHYKHLRHRGSIYWLDGMYIPRWLHVPVIHRILAWIIHEESRKGRKESLKRNRIKLSNN
jgi:hypothetical protein